MITSDIDDVDGMSNAVFLYQWIAVDDGVETDISGANRSSYHVQESDFGKRLKVRVRFSDDAGNQESLTSAAVGPIIYPLRGPSDVEVVAGDGRVGVSWAAPENERPNVNVLNYEVRWRAADSTGAYSSSGELSTFRYTITGLTNGEQISVVVRARYGLSSYGATSVSATPEATRSPQLQSADVTGSSLVMRYDSTLDDSSVPTSSAFDVLEDSTEVSVSSVEISGKAVWLTLASSVGSGATVTLSYDTPTGTTSGAIRDWVGNNAASFSDQSVTNASALSADSTLSSLEIADVSLTPTFAALTHAYTTTVAADVSVVTVSAEATDSDATLVIAPSVDVDPSVDGQQVNLDSGENVITVTVTAANEISESTYTVTITRSAGPPGAPRTAKLVSWDDGELSIEWKAPEYDGGSEITGYKVQWKSGTEEWDSSRQYDLKERFLNADIFGTYSRTIYNLTNDVEYTVRILAYNENGDGPASSEITGTPVSLQEELIEYIDDEIIGEYGDDHTWLTQAWNHMTRNNLVFNLVPGLEVAGGVNTDCPEASNGLPNCRVTRTYLRTELYLNYAKDTLDKVIIHELAHYFDFTHTLSDRASLAGFRLYVQSLGLHSNSSARCSVLELLADVMTLTVDGDRAGELLEQVQQRQRADHTGIGDRENRSERRYAGLVRYYLQ